MVSFLKTPFMCVSAACMCVCAPEETFGTSELELHMGGATMCMLGTELKSSAGVLSAVSPAPLGFWFLYLFFNACVCVLFCLFFKVIFKCFHFLSTTLETFCKSLKM